MMIQPTGLINPNQAESPGGILMKIQSTRGCSKWLDSREINFKEGLFVFKVLRTQGPLDPICLEFEVRIREKD